MPSTIGWLDHSEVQRRRMMEVVGLFREKATIDDLGIGSIRDTFSELLFPGTSTLHTRAKYLLFLPWICQSLEQDRVASSQGWERLKEREVALIYALLRGGEDEGVIGRDARENLKQFPSFMYWSALGRLGIRGATDSLGDYIASLDRLRVSRRPSLRTDDGERLDTQVGHWHSGLIPPEDGFLEHASFSLAQEQAGYLADRIMGSVPNSYYALLVRSRRADDIQVPWAHPALEAATPDIVTKVGHARRFSEVMHGAAFLYNLMLAEEVRRVRSAGGTVTVDEDLVDRYRDELGAWAERIRRERADIDGWDLAEFRTLVTTENPRIPVHTQAFVEWWIEQVCTRSPESLADAVDVRERIRQREFHNKGKLARLKNPRALEQWTGAAAVDQLTYRWGNVLPIVNEIRAALEGVDARA